MTQISSEELFQGNTLVAPICPQPYERAYWIDIENLMREYSEQKSMPISEEGRCGLHGFATWPLYEAEWSEWHDEWDFRFNVKTLKWIDGRKLLLEHIVDAGLMEGDDESAVVDELIEFLNWLGQHKDFSKTECDRLMKEVEESKPEFIKLFEEEPSVFNAIGDCCPQCARDVAVAPFVGWLRENGLPLDELLLGQSLCIDALEQLECPSIEEADWDNLDILECMESSCRQLPYLGLTEKELRRIACQMLIFLKQKRLLRRKIYRRLFRKAEMKPLRSSILSS